VTEASVSEVEEAADEPEEVPAQRYVALEQAPVDVELADLVDAHGRLEVYPAVESKDYFTIALSRGRLRLRARGYVGLIPLNDRVVIDVRPRVRIENFTRVLRVARYAPIALEHAPRNYALEQEWDESLLDVYSEALIDRVEAVRLRGLLREYQRHEEVSSYPKGRILVRETATRLAPRGLSHVAASTWHHRSADNAPNRCLKYALWFLAQRYTRLERTTDSRRILRRINRLYRLFDGVQLEHRRSFLRDALVVGRHRLPSLRAYYRPALDIALAIIREHAVSFEREGTALELRSLILNMHQIFEDYVRNVLAREANDNGWALRVLDGNERPGKKLVFDQRPSEWATPDVVIQEEGAVLLTPALLEVKYKPGSGADRSDLNQAITYAASYRSPNVVLVQPRGDSGPSGLRRLGTLGDISVYHYILDLGADDLAEKEVQFGQAVHQLCVASSALNAR
jgi:5-methylcytosine-specific restriction enzyme subunit McrC